MSAQQLNTGVCYCNCRLLSLPLIKSFNKTEVAIFPCRPCFLRATLSSVCYVVLKVSIVLLSLIVLYFPESVRKNAVSVKTFIKLFMTSKQQQSSLLIFHFRLFKRCTVPQTPSILFLKFVMYEVQTHFQWFKLHLFAE